MEKQMDKIKSRAELVKEEVKELKKLIFKIILKIWEKGIILHEWKYGIIRAIHKKGGKIIIIQYAVWRQVQSLFQNDSST